MRAKCRSVSRSVFTPILVERKWPLLYLILVYNECTPSKSAFTSSELPMTKIVSLCRKRASFESRIPASLSRLSAAALVNFKENRDLCMQERIVALPTIHLYVPGIGRMSRFTCTAANFAPKFRRALGSLVDSPERLSLLKSLQQEAVAPVIRYQQLMSVLQALSRADEFADSESAEDDRSRTLRNAAAADETFLKELEA
eukprot:4599676-Pleurochrysis_carterae.AAC.1